MLLPKALRWRHRDVIALVGAGGKTTLMFRLAQDLCDQGQRVVTTTTTRVYVSQMAAAPYCIVSTDAESILHRLPRLLERHRHVFVGRTTDETTQKVIGVEPGLVDQMARLSALDTVIVEADGARGRGLKAPAEHEPVIPDSTTVLVPLAGLEVIGQPLDDAHTHRPERIASLVGVEPGSVVTPEIVSAVLAHPRGGRLGAPTAARVVPFLNQADRALRVDWGRQIAGHLLGEPSIDAVAIGGAHRRQAVIEVWSRTAAIVLAAGGATRYGQPKLALPWRDTTLVGAVVDRALAAEVFDDVVVVLGSGAEHVQRALGARDVRTVLNEDWASGQSSSVQAGLEALSDNVGAAAFLLGDQPEVDPAVIRGLVRLHRRSLAPICVPQYDGQRGNPVLFDRAAFADLAHLSGDVGGRAVFERYAQRTAILPVLSPPPFDIDTPHDYAQALDR